MARRCLCSVGSATTAVRPGWCGRSGLAPARKALQAGRDLRLSRLEFDLLAPLAAEPTRVFTKCELLREVWGFKATGITR
jgi:DNA-binding response OmpR family regulator